MQIIARRRVYCLFAAVVLFLAAIGLFAYSTANFVAQVFPLVAIPIEEFDEGQLLKVETPRVGARYYLAVIVKSIDEPLPVVDVAIETPDGEQISTEPLQGYSRIFGRRYRHFLVIDPGEHRDFEILMAPTDPSDDGSTVDLALFYDPSQVFPEKVDAATPGWLTSAAIAALAFVCLCLAVFWRGKSPYLAALTEDRSG